MYLYMTTAIPMAIKAKYQLDMNMIATHRKLPSRESDLKIIHFTSWLFFSDITRTEDLD